MRNILFVIAALSLSGCFFSGKSREAKKVSSSFLPKDGAVDGLQMLGKRRSHNGQDGLKRYLGSYGEMFYQYGARDLTVADYYLGSSDRTLTVESYKMESRKAAVGLFHYHRGRKLLNRGTPIDAGDEGVVDKARQNRNVYFYKNNRFFKLIYTGKKPVADLVPLAKVIGEHISGGSKTPQGSAFLNVTGVNASTWKMSPGYTFNCKFLPPGIFAKAPGAGAIADAFIISHEKKVALITTATTYRNYLERNGLDFTIKNTREGRTIWWARDPDQGRVICTTADKYLIGIVRPQTFEAGEKVLVRIADKIDAQKKSEKKDGFLFFGKRKKGEAEKPSAKPEAVK